MSLGMKGFSRSIFMNFPDIHIHLFNMTLLPLYFNKISVKSTLIFIDFRLTILLLSIALLLYSDRILDKFLLSFTHVHEI